MHRSILLFFSIALVSSTSVPRGYKVIKPGQDLKIKFDEKVSIERWVKNGKNVEEKQVYTICNGKNEKNCGFWEDEKTKTKVGPETTYDLAAGVMTIKKATEKDVGTYRTKSYLTIDVIIPITRKD